MPRRWRRHGRIDPIVDGNELANFDSEVDERVGDADRVGLQPGEESMLRARRRGQRCKTCEASFPDAGLDTTEQSASQPTVVTCVSQPSIDG